MLSLPRGSGHGKNKVVLSSHWPRQSRDVGARAIGDCHAARGSRRNQLRSRDVIECKTPAKGTTGTGQPVAVRGKMAT
jgi:hypothetical protein